MYQVGSNLAGAIFDLSFELPVRRKILSNLVQPGIRPTAENLLNPHTIAVTIKAVPGVDGVAVRSQNEFAPSERADQNEHNSHVHES